MKMLPLVVLNFAVVLSAIVVYDLLRDDGPVLDTAPPPSAALGDAIAALEARTAALEARPIPLAKTPDEDLLRRLAELERRIGDAPEEGTETAATPTGEPGEPAAG